VNRKAALKAEYRQNWHRLRTMGVYQIRNQVSGKVFLGGSLNLEGALDRDRLMLSTGGHPNAGLQQDWRRCGPEAFLFEVLETLTPTDDVRDYAGEVALLLEAWLAQLEPYGEKGYLPTPRR
jgi:hypothetical protein